MTGQQLKNSILQWAIQGKLVPQDPTDEPASELLERIRTEKAQLIKEGKLKKGQPTSHIYRDDEGSYYEKVGSKEPVCINHEIPFDLPSGWEWCRLGDIITIKGGKRVPNGYKLLDRPTPHIYIRVSDMKDGSISASDLKYIDDAVYETIKSYTIGKDDLYLTIAGTIGRVGVVPFMFDNMNLTENAVKLTNILSDKMFLFYAISSCWIQSQFNRRTNQVAQPKLAIVRINSTLIPLPPLEEQKRIVARIEELMPLVEQYDKAHSELTRLNDQLPEQLKKSILQEAIQGKLVPQDPTAEPASVLLERIRTEKAQLIKEGKIKKGQPTSHIYRDDEGSYYEKVGSKDPVCINHEIPFDLPSGWEWCRLGDIGITMTGKTPPKSCHDLYGGDIPFLGPGNIIDGRVTGITQGLSHKGKGVANVVPPLTVLQVCIGSLGKCAIVYEEVTFNQQINSITPILCDVAYVQRVMMSELFRQLMLAKSTGTTIPIINRGNWETILFPLPPLEEQKRIVARIEELIPRIDKLR